MCLLFSLSTQHPRDKAISSVSNALKSGNSIRDNIPDGFIIFESKLKIMVDIERPKASDMFNKQPELFAKKGTFEEAYPDIEDFQINERFDLEHPPGEYFNCHNSRCYGGGVSIGKILQKMVRERLETFETTESCKGYEGSPKGRRKYQNCETCFKIKVTLKYKLYFSALSHPY
jgi:hypothetical protein